MVEGMELQPSRMSRVPGLLTMRRNLFGLVLLAAQLPLTMILWWPVIGRWF